MDLNLKNDFLNTKKVIKYRNMVIRQKRNYFEILVLKKDIPMIEFARRRTKENNLLVFLYDFQKYLLTQAIDPLKSSPLVNMAIEDIENIIIAFKYYNE